MHAKTIRQNYKTIISHLFAHLTILLHLLHHHLHHLHPHSPSQWCSNIFCMLLCIRGEESQRIWNKDESKWGDFLPFVFFFFILSVFFSVHSALPTKKLVTININGKIIVKLVCNIALSCLCLMRPSLTRTHTPWCAARRAHKHLSSDCKLKRLNDDENDIEKREGERAGERIKLFESNRHSNDFNPIHRSCCVIRIFITTSTRRASERCPSTRVYAILLYIFFFFTAVDATVAVVVCRFFLSLAHTVRDTRKNQM